MRGGERGGGVDLGGCAWLRALIEVCGEARACAERLLAIGCLGCGSSITRQRRGCETPADARTSARTCARTRRRGHAPAGGSSLATGGLRGPRTAPSVYLGVRACVRVRARVGGRIFGRWILTLNWSVVAAVYLAAAVAGTLGSAALERAGRARNTGYVLWWLSAAGRRVLCSQRRARWARTCLLCRASLVGKR